MNRFKTFILVFLGLGCLCAGAVKISEEDKEFARNLVSQMTLEEKISYLTGETPFSLRPIERLGIPRILLADGPQGIRNHCSHSTLYPCGVAAASTWNRQLLKSYGESLGTDALERGVGILLGPGVNIYRYPLCGRNFEYMGEDPYLASEMACNYIEGVQSKGVVATIKHFAGNNQEWNRHHASSDIDERTLHEIYFPTFRKAVEKTGVGAVMNSYNLLNGVHSTENSWLNKTILRDTWGFDGILMSDWSSVYSTVNAANSGLDLEMPGAVFFTDSLLRYAIDKGQITQKTIDDKVTHLLQTLKAFGLLDNERMASGILEGNEDSKQVALATAREGIVLLKNQDNILPLKGSTVLLGLNADTIVSGGGSGAVFPYSFTSLAEALPSLHEDTKFVRYDDMFEDASSNFYIGADRAQPGFKGRYYDNMGFEGIPALERTDSELRFDFGDGSPATGIGEDNFSIEWEGYYFSPRTENLRIAIGGDDGYRLSINDSIVAEHWGTHAYDRRIIGYPVEAGKIYDFKIEYYDAAGGAKVDIDVRSLKKDMLRGAIAGADNVVINTGFTSELESEGFDREYGLPEYEECFIREIAEINPNVTVVLNAGGAVDLMPWLNSAKAVLMAWYPGQEGGTAIAEILCGEVSPSGKLPFTWFRNLHDSPASSNYYAKPLNINESGSKEGDHIEYNEGIFHGYRGADIAGINPLYPFGYGLSYSTFEFSDLELTPMGENNVKVEFSVRNTGDYDAAEVAQVYVGDKECSVPRPLRELKGFEKIFLAPGESRRVEILLDEEAFMYYDLDSHKFISEPGEFDIYVGDSSVSLPLKGTVRL